MEQNKVLFPDLNADELESAATEIESMCMNCHKDGITRLLLTKIPFYKDVVIMSFSCEHCGTRNNEIQPGGPVAEKGVKITLNVKTPRDLNRQVVKSDYTAINIPDVDFEIPAQSQKGEITTIEGILDRCISGLEEGQPERRKDNAEIAEQIDAFIKRLKNLKESPFTIILNDISGNSFIENLNAPHSDPDCTTHFYTRTTEQDHSLGVYSKQEVSDSDEALLRPSREGQFTLEDLEGEVMQFNTICPGCRSSCETNMKLTNIPHFKEVVIMATNCESCGLRTNEVKSGGGIEPKGVHIEVDVHTKDDFSRDVLKSETCSLSIPELKLEVGPHALGGRFTTIEGLVVAVKIQLNDPTYTHIFGDSQDIKSKQQFEDFMKNFDEILEGRLPITIVMDDPAGNSYIQSMNDDNTADERLRVTHYERTFDQNEELGLNDMKTENYADT